MSAANPKPVYVIRSGAGGLPMLELSAPDGARAEICLQGAHVTSWVPDGGHERLFLSKVSEFRPGAPIRGGIPVVFPQFGTSGPLPPHGFARRMPWELAEAQESEERASAVFRLRDSQESRDLWPHPFLAELAVSVGGKRLEVTFSVTNTGAEPFNFTAALHTYLRVFYLADVCVEGLTGLRYRDAAAGGVEKSEKSAEVDFWNEVNRVYFQAPEEVLLVEPGRRTVIQKTGFTDTVVWNPAAVKCAAMPDLEPDAYRRFVCVEAATVGEPVCLAPRDCWQGTQTIEV